MVQYLSQSVLTGYTVHELLLKTDHARFVSSVTLIAVSSLIAYSKKKKALKFKN